MKYVIIGNSTAAVACVEGIRSTDSFGQITIISSEKYHTYSRPLISYLLQGKTDMERMKYRGNDFYEKNKCSCLFERTAAKINPEEKTVTLSNGGTVPYDKLLVATGSKPFVPPMKGLENVKNKFNFMSLDNALDLEKKLKKSSRVLIIGAGLIGLKCAEGISGKCKSITVVDLADKVMPSVLDERSSEMVKDHIEKQGINFILSDSVAEFNGSRAVLKSGTETEFDIVVLAVGVKPNTELIAECGGKVNKGIVTDFTGLTSIEDVYAAGDCTESYDITSNSNKILALLPNAYLQGETAGINMAGGSKTFENAVPLNSIGFFGLHIATAGSYEGESYVTSTSNSYKRLITRDNRLVGFILVGDVAKAGIYTSMIREQMPLDSLDFQSIRENPSMIAMNEGYRRLKLSAIKQ
ncbi:MAG: FAD-dependent oxidoreductase [Clostridiales bacterium]|nr:FAD-dependent oxidoreductase [Clostridiales bacterium]